MKKQYKILKLNNKEIEELKNILIEKIFDYNIKKNELEEKTKKDKSDIDKIIEIQYKCSICKNIFNIINYLER